MAEIKSLLPRIIISTGTEEVIYARVGDSVTLNIPDPPKSNFYIYWCFGTQTESFIWFNHLVHMNPPSPVMPSDSVVLSCNTETPQGLTNPKVYWTNPQENTEHSDQGKLRFTAKSQVSGQWTCVVSDKKLFKFPITVSVADFSAAPPSQYTSTNSPLKVPFLITPDKLKNIAQKIKKVEWHFTPKTSSSPQRLFSVSLGSKWMETVDQSRGLTYTNFTKGGNFSLSKNWAGVDDRGTYTCSVTFLNGFVLNSTVQVEVLQIVPSPGVKLISGNQLNLSCSTGDQLLPGIQVKWLHPKRSSLRAAGPPSDRLVIPKVSTEDSGTWRCELLQNWTRLTSAEITLSIEPVLSVWMLVTICSAGVILILLLVVGFILYRRRQRRMRHLRHQLCQCAHPKPKGFYKT
ncbi:CD4-1 molecule [Nematolebias whitei]|uniref:CD4-1 molecule n=1 Tax=Nematolebias whitei TaxID=451745 RepID=UPI001899E4A5|nr:CD4-1 molecule [Nematolebias whitei]